MDYPATCPFEVPPVRYDPHDLDPDPDADLAAFQPQFGLLADLDFDGDVEFCIDDLLDFHDAEDPDPPPPPPPADSSSQGSDGPAASSSSSAPAAGPVDSSDNSSPESRDNYAASSPSPESGGSSTKPPPPPPPASEARVIEEKDEPSDGSKPGPGGLKRKKESSSEDEESDETNARSSTANAADANAAAPSSKSRARIRRAAPAIAADEADSSAAGGFPSSGGADDDEKRRARLMRNRESAQLSRQRKKQYVEELEDKVRAMHSTISDLNSKISYIMAENATLRHQLGATTAASATGNSNGKSQGSPSSNSASPIPAAVPPLGVGVYPAVPPMAPMPFPWIPGYAVRPPPGAQVPLVPIPRLRTQQAAPPAKTRKTSDAGKKGESKTKKVASVSFLGMMLFLLLVGAFLPRGNLRMGGGISSFSINRAVDPSRGRVLTVTGIFDRFNLTHGNVDPLPPDSKRSAARELRGGKPDIEATQGGSSLLANASEPLIASLYVPRNDKLVKIDGNLIISSVLASEKAMAHKSSGFKTQNKPTVISGNGNNKESDLALAGSVVSALAVANSAKDAPRLPAGRSRRPVNPKALPSGPRDMYRENLKSIPADSPTQEWFREGLEGPILSSGMCTEVFQFDASPASSSIFPATSAVNATNNQTGQPPYPGKVKSRRILYAQQPIPLAGPSQDNNNSNKAFGGGATNFGHTKAGKSMVVSVLVDPREVGDGDVDAVLSPKSISRIFVVVLVDSVKYITYSCVLPFKSNAPHLVTA